MTDADKAFAEWVRAEREAGAVDFVGEVVPVGGGFLSVVHPVYPDDYLPADVVRDESGDVFGLWDAQTDSLVPMPDVAFDAETGSFVCKCCGEVIGVLDYRDYQADLQDNRDACDGWEPLGAVALKVVRGFCNETV